MLLPALVLQVRQLHGRCLRSACVGHACRRMSVTLAITILVARLSVSVTVCQSGRVVFHHGCGVLVQDRAFLQMSGKSDPPIARQPGDGASSYRTIQSCGASAHKRRSRPPAVPAPASAMHTTGRSTRAICSPPAGRRPAWAARSASWIGAAAFLHGAVGVRVAGDPGVADGDLLLCAEQCAIRRSIYRRPCRRRRRSPDLPGCVAGGLVTIAGAAELIPCDLGDQAGADAAGSGFLRRRKARRRSGFVLLAAGAVRSQRLSRRRRKSPRAGAAIPASATRIAPSSRLPHHGSPGRSAPNDPLSKCTRARGRCCRRA